MAIDPKTIERTTVQKQRLARLAERSGKHHRQVIDELLAEGFSNIDAEETDGLDGPKNLSEALDAFVYSLGLTPSGSK